MMKKTALTMALLNCSTLCLIGTAQTTRLTPRFPLIVRAVNSSPQLVEYGSLTEIVTSSRVYVYSGDFEAREKIVKVLEKDGVLKVVGKPEDADFMIAYGTQSLTTGFASFFNVTTAIGVDIGDFVVAKRGDPLPTGEPRARILWAGRRKVGPSSPFVKKHFGEEQLTKKFMKELERARKQKS